MSNTRTVRSSSLELPVHLVLENGELRHATFDQAQANHYVAGVRRARGSFDNLELIHTTATIHLR